MKRLLTAAAIFVALLALPLITPVHAQEPIFISVLTGDQEVPPVVTDAYGYAVYYVYYVFDEEGAVVPNIYYYLYTFGLENPVTGSHIHPGVPGMNGPVILPLTIPTAKEGDVLSSEGNLTPADLRPGGGILTMDDVVHAMVSGDRLYTNVHTTASPGGRIRGSVVRYEE